MTTILKQFSIFKIKSLIIILLILCLTQFSLPAEENTIIEQNEYSANLEQEEWTKRHYLDILLTAWSSGMIYWER